MLPALGWREQSSPSRPARHRPLRHHAPNRGAGHAAPPARLALVLGAPSLAASPHSCYVGLPLAQPALRAPLAAPCLCPRSPPHPDYAPPLPRARVEREWGLDLPIA